MASRGWGSRGASHRAPQSWLFPGRFLGRPYVANSTELHRFRPRNPSRTLDFVPCLFLPWGVTLLLRKSSAQARIEGWDPRNRSDDDYAVVDDTIVGRIYREMILGKPKWRWFLQQIPEAGPGRPIPPSNQGMADTLDEAQAAFKRRYEQVRWGK
jgi:hypothetical protein